MSKAITISVPDETYEALRSAGEQAHKSPEELAAAAITERFGTQHSTVVPDRQVKQAKDDFLALMRTRGYLVDAKSMPPHPGVTDLPAPGSPERAKLEVEIGDALSEAFERSGLSISDLIERR